MEVGSFLACWKKIKINNRYLELPVIKYTATWVKIMKNAINHENKRRMEK